MYRRRMLSWAAKMPALTKPALRRSRDAPSVTLVGRKLPKMPAPMEAPTAIKIGKADGRRGRERTTVHPARDAKRATGTYEIAAASTVFPSVSPPPS